MSVTFNILGDCVSRDILQAAVTEGSIVVNRYVSFMNPVSLLSNPADPNLEGGIEELSWGSNFAKRNLALDIRSSGLDYLFSEPSDYLIVDFLDARMNLLATLDGQAISRSNIVVKNEKQVREMLGPEWHVVAYDEVPENEYIAAVTRICDEILLRYSPNQVIVNKHFGVEEYIFNSVQLREFNSTTRQRVQKYNALVEKLFTVAINRMPGCHVIEFPESVLGTSRNKWGLFPLHYSDSYYEYGHKAINAIIEGGENISLTLERLKWQTTLKYINIKHSFELREQKTVTRKVRQYFDVADYLVQGGSALVEQLSSANVSSVALWGDFLVARTIKSFLEQRGIGVDYMVSAWTHGTCEKVFPPSSKSFPKTDALIVCDVLAGEQVRERMKNSFPLVITVGDIVS